MMPREAGEGRAWGEGEVSSRGGEPHPPRPLRTPPGKERSHGCQPTNPEEGTPPCVSGGGLTPGQCSPGSEGTTRKEARPTRRSARRWRWTRARAGPGEGPPPPRGQMSGVSPLGRRAHRMPAVIQSSVWPVPHPVTLEASQTHLQAPGGLTPQAVRLQFASEPGR